MSADKRMDCPSCGCKNSVRIFCIEDIELTKEGKIIHKTYGRCLECCKLYY